MKNVGYECCDATYRGIHDWYHAMFEKLGWMIIAKRHGMMDKVSTYKNSLDRLKQTILKKHKLTVDKDKKTDLMIMLDNLEILIAHAAKDL